MNELDSQDKNKKKDISGVWVLLLFLLMFVAVMLLAELT
jgi:hypothetical protein